MGDPKKSRRQYITPSHPWEGERIASEKELVRKYGLKNKTELWKAQTALTRYRSQAKELMARTRVADLQGQIESDLLKKKLVRLGLLTNDNSVNDVLSLDVEDILNRRLQTVVYHKGLAGTQKQARQFVTHGHIAIDDRVVNIPSRMLTKKEEEAVVYSEFSDISNELHPARPQEHGVVMPEEPKAEEEKPKEHKVTHKAQKVLDKVKADAKEVEGNIDDAVAPVPAETETEEKKADAPAEKKAEEKKTEAPKKEAKAEAPKKETKADKPAEAKVEAPKKETKTEAPKKEAKVDAKKPEGGEE